MDVEYILRIVLRARNELASAFAKARAEVAAFAAETKKFNKDLDGLNTRITSLNQRVGNVTNKINDWRAAMRGFGTDSKDAEKSSGDLAKEVEHLAESADTAVTKNKNLTQQFRTLKDAHTKLSQDFRNGKRDRDDLVFGLDRISSELDKLSKKTKLGSDLSFELQKAARAAKDEANAVVAAEKSASDERIRIAKSVAKTREDEAKRAAAAEVAAVKAAEKAQADADTARQRRIAKQLADDAKVAAARTRQRAKEAAEQAQVVRDAETLAHRIENTRTNFRSFSDDVSKGGVSTSSARAEFRRFAGEFDNLAKQFKIGSDESRRFGTEAERVRGMIRGLGNDSRRSSRDIDDGTGVITKFWQELGKAGDNVATLDNRIRGIGLLLAVGFAQQLISAVVALGGNLVALAGSAAQAGAALGGAFVAGAAQAIPAIGLLSAAVSRVGAVMSAFKQSQSAQQQAFVQHEVGAKRTARADDQAANASRSLSQANDRVAEAQRNLGIVRREALRDLHDMVLAEKEAELAAKGAALSQKDSQEALRQAVLSGGDVSSIERAQLDTQEASLRRRRATTDLGRQRSDLRATGGDPNNLESVRNAQRALNQAEQGVEAAQQQVDTAARHMNEAAAGTQTAAATLQFFLSQLSPAERRLYDALQTVYKDYRRVFIGDGTGGSGILGVITDSFTHAVNRGITLLSDKRLLDAARGMSQGIATSINRVVDALTTPRQLAQFERITEAGRKNLEPITTILIRIGHALANIAEAAGPSFSKLLGFINGLVLRFLKLTENKSGLEDFFNTGERHLESWINLGIAVIRMFAALTGAGGATTGLRTVNDATKAIDGLTNKIQHNRGEVGKFFEEARQATRTIVGVVAALAVELFKAWDSRRLQDFAHLLEQVVIPALGIVLKSVGGVADAITRVLTLPVIGDLSKWGVAFLLLAQASASTIGAFAYFGKIFEELGNSAKLFTGIGPRLVKYGETLKVASQFAAATAERNTFLSRTFNILGTSVSRAGSMIRATSAFMLGPWGLAIIAVVAGVVLLLNHFGKLDDVGRAITQTWDKLVAALQGPLKNLQSALDEIGIHIEDTGEALAILNGAGKILADLISTYLIAVIQQFGRMLATSFTAAINVLAGLIRSVHGLVDILVGLFTLDFSQLGRGFSELARGIVGIGSAIVVGFIGTFKNLVSSMLLPFRLAWQAIKRFFGVSSPSRLAQDLGNSIIDGIKAGLRGLVEIMTAPYRLAWRGIRAAFSGAASLGGWIIDRIRAGIRREINGLRATGSWIWNGIKSAVRSIVGVATDIGGWIFDRLKSAFRAEIRGFRNIGRWIWEGLSDAIHGVGHLLESLGGRIVDAIVRGIKSAPGKFKDAIGSLIPDITPWSGALPFAYGGPVPGYGGGDTISAKLEKGEHVWTKEEVKSAGGHGMMYAMRAFFGGGRQSSGPGYAFGGAAQNNPQGSWVVKQRGATIAEDKQAHGDEEKEDLRSQSVRAKQWQDMWEDLKAITRRGANYVEEQFRDMRVNTSRSVDRMYRDIRGSIADIQNSFKVRGGQLVDSWADTWRSLNKLAYDGLFYIGHEANRSLHAFGAKTINFGLSAPTAERKATGGFMVPGSGDGDKIPALLEPGEFVLNKIATSKIGKSVLEFLNFEGFPRFAEGGFTGPGHSGAGFTPIWNMAKNKFGMTYFTGFDGHSKTTSTGNVSDHFFHRALDMGNGVLTAAEDGLNHFFKTKTPQIVKQLIWRGIDQFHGYNIGDHEDHAHLAMPDEYAFNGPLVAKILSRAMRGLSISDLLVAGTDDLGMPTVDHIDHLPVKGPKGPMWSMMQRLFNLVRRSGNKYIDDKATIFPGVDSGLEVRLDSGASSAGKTIFDFFRGVGFKAAQAAAWVGNFTQESGLNPSAVQPNGQGHGLGQWGGGRFAALENFAKSRGTNWTDLATQLAFVMYELSGPESAAYQAIKSTDSISGAVSAIAKLYERAGIIGDRLGPARSAFNAYAHMAHGGFVDSFASGGVVPGQGGTSRPIIAHAGEWILNTLQQSKLAQLLGTNTHALRSLLGFHGGPDHFQGGGPVPTLRVADEGVIDTGMITRLLNAIKQLGKIQLPDLGQDEFRSVSNLFGDIDGIFERMQRLSRIADDHRTKTVRSNAVNKFLSSIDKITGDQGLLDRLRASIERRQAQASRALTAATFHVGRDRTVTRSLDPTQAAQRQLQDTRTIRTDLLDERDAIAGDLASVRHQQRRHGLTAAQKQKLQGQENKLQQRLDDAGQRVSDNLSDIFDAQDALLQANIQKQQDAVDDINKGAQRATSAQDIVRRLGQAFGNTGIVAQANQAQREILDRQARELQGRIGAARAAGATDLADQIEDQVQDIRTQITESIAQELRDAADQIQQSAQRRTGRLDLFNRLLDATGTVGQTAAVTLGGESFSRAGVFAQRGGVLEGQRVQTQDLLQRVLREQPENMGLVQDLTDQLAELDVTIKENARAAFQAQIDAVNQQATFGLGLNDLNKQVIDLTGQISGNIDQTALLTNATERGTILQEQRNSLEALLAQAQAAGDQAAVQDLTTQLLQNQVAILQNTVSLNELNGVIADPQTFTSSAWTWFRRAIFSGMGQVLPQYQIPMADTGGVAMRSGMYHLQPGELYVPSQWSGGSTKEGDFSLTINEAGRPVDTTEIAAAVGFARKTSRAS